MEKIIEKVNQNILNYAINYAEETRINISTERLDSIQDLKYMHNEILLAVYKDLTIEEENAFDTFAKMFYADWGSGDRAYRYALEQLKRLNVDIIDRKILQDLKKKVDTIVKDYTNAMELYHDIREYNRFKFVHANEYCGKLLHYIIKKMVMQLEEQENNAEKHA